jgi:PKD repeat protein
MPDGRTTFVLDTIPPSVYSVDVDTGAKGPAVALPDFPHGIAAIAPSQAPTAAFSNAPALSGLPTTFDASPSAASCGAIATYRWDFGDGAVVTTSTPTIDHEYETAGTYDVTLTVADAAGTSTTKVFTGQATLRNGGPEAQVSQEVVVGQGPVVATPSFTG